ncbi:hypothetical protein EFV37_13110 [Mesorhizobium loti]|uniref:Uncharacterized protein n=2 Tax=Mesorhizobium jarvisii TaxID=1777867 RepID=A0A6M7TI30_9HYPH|nr:hypothetical protein EB229_13100 [Mesorhizobium jarvisii]QKD09048.1 hypothetical protein EFV37_13110 [Mesorhizobium loti]RJT30144.1 hypothetical protein D3242_25835 [Mesorhizobium jarvisii]
MFLGAETYRSPRVVESGELTDRGLAGVRRGRFGTPMAYRSTDIEHLHKSLAAQDRIRRAGRTPNGHALWTTAERAVLKKWFPDYIAMKMRLPERSMPAIRGQCHLMGLSTPKPAWTAADRARLKRLFPTVSKDELIAAFPGRTWTSLQVSGYQMGLKRWRKPYVKTSHPVIDDVREACRAKGHFMPDLDVYAGTGKYFSKLAQRRKKHDFRKVDKAVKALGGTLTIEWCNDDSA